jgi:hypothetical protein
MEQGGPLVAMANTLVKGFGAIAGAAVMVVIGWQFLKVILSGGSERALLNVGKIVLVVGIATAALGHRQKQRARFRPGAGRGCSSSAGGPRAGEEPTAP